MSGKVVGSSGLYNLPADVAESGDGAVSGKNCFSTVSGMYGVVTKGVVARKAAEGGRLCALRCRSHRTNAIAASTTTARPPIIPPAIAPTLVFFEDELGATTVTGVVDWVGVTDEVDDGVRLEDDVADAVEAVNSVSFIALKASAAVAFHKPSGTSIYAHAGMAVPAGIVTGNWSTYDLVQFVFHVAQGRYSSP